jgi:phage protein D
MIECTVYLTNYQSASEFTAELALDSADDPGIQFWSNQSGPITASIEGDNGDGTGQGVLISGTINRVSINMRTRVVSVHGTDQTQKLINTRSDESFQNQTPSQIVTTIAGRHGLTPHVDSSSDKAGKTFDFNNFAFNSDIQNDWDTLVQLAEREGKVVYIIGNDLYWTTAGNTTGSNLDITYTPPTPASYATGNFVELKVMIDYELATADSKLTSWHTSKKAPVVGEEPITGGSAGNAGEGSIEFYDRKPGLTQDQAQAQATSTAKMAGAFQKQIEIDVPGDVTVTQSMMVNLSGTQSSWDQAYYIESVTHKFSTHQGYRMTIEAKNVDPGSGLGAPGTGDL